MYPMIPMDNGSTVVDYIYDFSYEPAPLCRRFSNEFELSHEFGKNKPTIENKLEYRNLLFFLQINNRRQRRRQRAKMIAKLQK